MMRCGIALGSNVGDRLAHLRAGRAALMALHAGPEAPLFSSIYETEPVDCAAGTEPYLNAVVEIETAAEPQALLEALLQIERAEGRPAEHGRNAPRTLDLDLLYAEEAIIQSPSLTLPHPRMTERRFVLQPLAEIRPALVLPGAARPVAELLMALPSVPTVHFHDPFAMNTRLDSFRTAKAEGRKIAMLTAYDYPTARLLDEAGVDVLLVGDSLGMVVLGYPDTTLVTLEEMVHHTRAVARGAQRAPVVADLPIHSYDTPEQALANARRLMEAGAHAVKLEGGKDHAPQIAAITGAGIPVVAHIGMLPQSVREEGGYKIKGKTPEAAQALVEDGLAVEAAGAMSVVVELVKAESMGPITRALRIPTIGIGSGADCDGQVLVIHDLAGLFPWFTPKFVQPLAAAGEAIRNAAAAYVARVHEG